MFRAAFYETEVTAPLGSLIPGSYSKRYAEDVRDRLYAKAVVIDNGTETVAMVVMDSVELPDDIHDVIAERVEAYTGIKAENIMVACNHTHTGAPIVAFPEVGVFEDEAYVSVTTRLMADCITLAYRRLENVKIKYGCGEVYGMSFNRDYVMRDGTIIMNAGRANSPVTELHIVPEVQIVKFEDAQKNIDSKIINPNCVGNLAGIDPELPVLYFENEEGKAIGAVINFACHQTCLSNTEISGDYSSILAKELKKVYGEDFVSLFLIGTAGDINHVDPTISVTPKDTYIKVGKRLAEETVRVVNSAEEITGNELLSRKEKLEIKKRIADAEAINREVRRWEKTLRKSSSGLRNMLYYQVNSTEEYAECYVQCIRIGDVYLYALPGEVYVNFGLQIKEKSPSRKNLISELANGPYWGYIPTKEAFLPQSILYEASLCRLSHLVPEGGYIISDKALELAGELSDK